MTEVRSLIRFLLFIAVIGALVSIFGNPLHWTTVPRENREKVEVWFKATFDDPRGVVVAWTVGPIRNPGEPATTSPWSNRRQPITARRGDPIEFRVISLPQTDRNANKSCEVFVNDISREGPWHGQGQVALDCVTSA